MEIRVAAALPAREAANSKTRRAAVRRCLLGAASALIVFEICLRPFVAGWNYPVAPVREIRQYAEGIAAAHFAPDGIGTYGRRLTGNPQIAGAPVGVILGDSNLVSEQVADDQVVGSVAERLFRAGGRPMNVAQYGWYAGAAPVYVVAAPKILATWRPEWVAVVLNHMTLGRLPLTEDGGVRMKVHPDFSIELIDERPKPETGRMEQVRQFAGRSRLLLALRRRTVVATFREPEANSAHPDAALAREIERVPRASVRALQKAYGSRLIIVYAPYCDFEAVGARDPMEAALLEACRAEGARCVSVRGAMLRERAAHERMTRGFHNSVLGGGHLNPVGHRVVAGEIWRALSGSAAPAGGG